MTHAPMLVTWSIALVISLVATTAVTSLVDLSGQSIVGALTIGAAGTRLGLGLLLRH